MHISCLYPRNNDCRFCICCVLCSFYFHSLTLIAHHVDCVKQNGRLTVVAQCGRFPYELFRRNEAGIIVRLKKKTDCPGICAGPGDAAHCERRKLVSPRRLIFFLFLVREEESAADLFREEKTALLKINWDEVVRLDHRNLHFFFFWFVFIFIELWNFFVFSKIKAQFF